jgi:tetratricopeptide (TPR) repeat protein
MPRHIDEIGEDVLFALCSLLESDCPQSDEALAEIQSIYQMVAALSWPNDHFDERCQVLSRLAFLAWNLCLRYSTFEGAREWRDRCVSNVLSQESERAFLAIPFHKRSGPLNERFLGDPTVLLATCALYERRRNLEPQDVALEAGAAWRWISGEIGPAAPLYRQFLAAEICMSLGIASKHLGRFDESLQWISRARSVFADSYLPDSHLARCDFNEIAVAYERNEVQAVLERIEHNIRALKQGGFLPEYDSARLLEACALKNVGRMQEASSRLSEILDEQVLARSPLVHCLALIAKGEAEAGAGRPEKTGPLMAAAATQLRVLNAPLVSGNFYASLGEFLRDQDRLDDAVESYRASVATFEVAGLARAAAYIRVILAETLVAAGRQLEAIEELVRALPTIRRGNLDSEAKAATAILSESLRRKCLDPLALTDLRNQLRAWRDGEES